MTACQLMVDNSFRKYMLTFVFLMHVLFKIGREFDTHPEGLGDGS